MFYYSTGELFAIAAAATIGVFLFVEIPGNPLTPLTTLIILGVAGCVEGLVIGWIQWKSFTKVVLHLKGAAWITTTTLSAMAGWLLILPPAIVLVSVLARFSLITSYSSFLYAAAAGIAFGAIMGVPQFFYLKKLYHKAGVWILANVLGWMGSFVILYTFISLLKSSGSFAYNFSLIIISCGLSGIVQGLVTGTALHYFMSAKQAHLRAGSTAGPPLFAENSQSRR